MTLEEEALFANDTFYLAFTQKDFPAMQRLWAATHATLCIHPGWHALSGPRRNRRELAEHPREPPTTRH